MLLRGATMPCSAPRGVSISASTKRQHRLWVCDETWNVVCTCAHMARYINEYSSCSRGVVPRTQRQPAYLRGCDAPLYVLVGDRRNSLAEAFNLAIPFIWVWGAGQRQRFTESRIRTGRWRAGVSKQRARVSRLWATAVGHASHTYTR